MIYRTDYHMHSTFSDGRSSPEEYIGAAIEAGLNEIGFSEHLTLFRDPEEWNMNPENIPAYINHLDRLRKQTLNIKIRTGLEVDFFPGKEKEIRSFVEHLPLDYIIGSVHFMFHNHQLIFVLLQKNAVIFEQLQQASQGK